MGSYSSFDYDDITVTDAKGLVDFLLKIKNKDKCERYEYMYKDFLENVIDGKQYSFESWDDIKLISYWYEHQVMFLSLISKYMDGNVSFTFEDNETKAEIVFNNGKTIIKLGDYVYRDVKPMDFLDAKNNSKKRKTITTKNFIDELDDEYY